MICCNKNYSIHFLEDNGFQSLNMLKYSLLILNILNSTHLFLIHKLERELIKLYKYKMGLSTIYSYHKLIIYQSRLIIVKIKKFILLLSKCYLKHGKLMYQEPECHQFMHNPLLMISIIISKIKNLIWVLEKWPG